MHLFVELHFEFPYFYRDQVLGKNASTEEVWFRDRYLYAVSPISTHYESHINMVTHILHGLVENHVVH